MERDWDQYEASEGHPSVREAEFGGEEWAGEIPLRDPSSFTHPFPYQIKNPIFRDKIIPRQDVDLHGVAKVGDEELVMGKETRYSQTTETAGSTGQGEWKDPC